MVYTVKELTSKKVQILNQDIFGYKCFHMSTFLLKVCGFSLIFELFDAKPVKTVIFL